MVLVDTSVWARHLRHGDPDLERLLYGQQVLLHPFVRIELASRRLENRSELLDLLASLPEPTRADDDEVMELVARRGLAGAGLGLVDLHLLASSLLSEAPLWTADRRLASVARSLEIAYE